MDKDEWGTPQDLFDTLDQEFHFTLDPCGNSDRILKENMITYTKKERSPARDWYRENVFVNPPYSGNNIKLWMRKCFEERYNAHVIVMLIPPTKTGTKYFKEYVIDGEAWTRFITGRVQFIPLGGQGASTNPLYSMLIIWRG